MMPTLHIKDTKTGAEATAPLECGSVTVGSDAGNDIVLEFPDIARRHCEIGWTGDEAIVRDCDSRTGTFMGSRRVRGETAWRPSDTLRLGSVHLRIVIPEAPPDPAPPRRELHSRVGALPPLPVAAPTLLKPPPAPAAKPKSESIDRTAKYKSKIREYLVDHPETKRLIHTSPNDAELRDALKRLIKEAGESAGLERPAGLSEEALTKEMVDEILGLGPLEDLMKDESVTEVMVNRFDHILIERAGSGIEKHARGFLDEDHLLETVRRILAPLGRHLNETTPLVDARLKDGTRINAVIPPVSIGGCVLTMRKFSSKPFTLERLAELGSVTPAMAEMLKYAVKARLNVIVSGGTGTGKTSFLNGLAGLIPAHERMVVIEDTHELRFEEHPNCVYLEARPANLEGKNAIPIRRLVINALRMRPDRIIVGECRGDESFDMLQAMNTGHLGSMTTVHANSPRDAMMRIENMVLMAGFELPSQAIRKQVASAINLVIQLSRVGTRGARRVTSISEISGVEGQTITMQELYKTDEEGALSATGAVPKFLGRVDQKERARLIKLFGMGS